MFDFFRKEKDPKKELEKLVGEVDLPSFSASIMHILNTLRNVNFHTGKVVEQIEGDPGLHVKILKVVNSAAFGLATKAENLQQAVTLLGKSRLEALVLSQAVHESLPTIKLPFFNMSEFWLSSARRACLARAFAKILHPNTQTESFSAALLQNMALPILLRVHPDSYKDVWSKWSLNKTRAFHLVEKEVLGYDHFYVGGLMAVVWDLPEYLIASLSRTNLKKIEKAVDLVALLDCYDPESLKESLISQARGSFELSDETFIQVLEEALEAAEDLSKLLR